MHLLSVFLLVFCSPLFCLCAPRPERAQALKEAFRFSWQGYYDNAFPHDELQPVSNTPGDSRNGWGCTAVDTLSTAIIMEEAEIVNQIVDYIPSIDFSKSNKGDIVSLFETTIRYLAGLLSGYDLLTGPAAGIVPDDSKVRQLLEQAASLADNLSFAFNTSSGVPSNENFLNNRTHHEAGFTFLAAVGTLVLEWTHLSDLTGNSTYADMTQKAEDYLLNPSPPENSPWPGLLGSLVSLEDGHIMNNIGGWGSGADSYYEYLIKMFVYDPSRFETYRDHWITVAESSMKYLVSHPDTRPDLTFLAQYHGQELNKKLDVYSCFDGGNFILGGTVLDRQDFVEFGLKLVDSCRATYAATVTGLGPQSFSWETSDVAPDQQEFFNDNGFFIRSAINGLNPELIESYYYAYQATGNETYQDWAWDIWLGIEEHAKTNTSYAGIWNVNEKNGGAFLDTTNSFFYAEVLKYSYLIQAEPRPWDITGNGKENWVYNTEAHPLKCVSQGSSSPGGSSGSSSSSSSLSSISSTTSATSRSSTTSSSVATTSTTSISTSSISASSSTSSASSTSTTSTTAVPDKQRPSIVSPGDASESFEHKGQSFFSFIYSIFGYHS